MKIIGLTGGIGSGKTTVGEIFSCMGIPVFNSDKAAKKLYSEPKVIEFVQSEFGENVVDSGKVNFKKLAQVVFADEQKLEALNHFLHPLVKEVFQGWVKNQTSNLVVKEAAILFESGAHEHCDVVLNVHASKNERIKRVIKRDLVSQQEVEARMNRQWTSEQRRQAADCTIENNEQFIVPQVLRFLNAI